MRSEPGKDAVAQRLKEARGRLFNTAADAARALNMKPVTVRAHESGQNKPSYYDLEKYARRFGVSLAWLLTGEGEQSPQDDVERHHHLGQHLFIHSLVEDGAWIPADPESDLLPTRVPMAPDGDPEFSVYSDPRFPAEMVTAFKVVTHRPSGEYLNGSIVFVVPAAFIGYRAGDHVIVASERDNFFEWSLRRVEVGADNEERWVALTSDAAPIRGTDDDGQSVRILGVVIGSETRRPVPALDLRERQEWELGLALEEGRRMSLPRSMVTRDAEHDMLLKGLGKKLDGAM